MKKHNNKIRTLPKLQAERDRETESERETETETETNLCSRTQSRQQCHILRRR